MSKQKKDDTVTEPSEAVASETPAPQDIAPEATVPQAIASVPQPDVPEAATAPREQQKEQQTSYGKGAAPEQFIHLVVFKLGTEEYAFKIEQVKEVTVTPSITQMPRTPHFIKGVANVRGDIIAIMDLEERFQIRPAPVVGDGLGNTYTLVIEAKDYSIGVVVKEVPQSLNLPLSKIDKAPSFLQDINVQENYIEGIAKIGDRLIIVLDMFKILTVDEIKQLAGQA